jgi:hypothetical protein
VFSQPIDVPQKLLIQIDENDLSEDSKERLTSILNNEYLSTETIKSNPSIEPLNQIELAKYLLNNLTECYPKLRWSRFPNYPNLDYCCNLIWDYFIDSARLGGISSGIQLAYKINELRKSKSVKALIRNEISAEIQDYDKINESIEDTLEFVRYWAQFHFPNYLRALDRIQKEILTKQNLIPGNYSFFAMQVECLFTKPLFAALDEYGIPIQTSNRLKDRINADTSFDNLLLEIKNLHIDDLDLSEFEKKLIRDAKQYL